MIVFPNCKINLGLNILQKRSDGFHDLETIFYPIAIHDVLEIISSHKTNGPPATSITLSGLEIDGGHNNNICLKAIGMLREKFPELPSIKMHLHKIIPTGAGLGGGSADAAFTLELMNKICELNLSTEQLISLATEAGSDCPFFIINKPCFSKGRGELLKEIELDLSSYQIIVVNPGIPVNTKEAFEGITPALPEVSVQEIIKKPIHAWKAELKNDFEETIFSKYPAIEQIKDELYNAGSLYASMSGSGSTVYGLFSKNEMPAITFPPHYFVRVLQG